MEPLDRFLARRLALPIREVRRRIQWGRVAVDGQRCQRYHLKLPPGTAVAMDGAEVADGPDVSVLVLHKPRGLACSHDAEEGPLIYDLVPPAWRHPDLHSCGRLDRDTTGLLLLTSDGQVTRRLMDPGRRVAKRYLVEHTGELPADATQRVAAGMTLVDDPRPLLPARLEVSGPGRCAIELHEGRHHQVKRMIRDLGSRVTALHRERIGSLDLPADLAPGAIRPATRAELRAAGCELPWWAGAEEQPAPGTHGQIQDENGAGQP